MIAVEAGCLRVQAPMVMGNARQLLALGRQQIEAGVCRVDLSAVEEADSSAIAVMLAWLRLASNLRSTLLFSGIPAGVLALAELYGLVDLLPQA